MTHCGHFPLGNLLEIIMKFAHNIHYIYYIYILYFSSDSISSTQQNIKQFGTKETTHYRLSYNTRVTTVTTVPQMQLTIATHVHVCVGVCVLPHTQIQLDLPYIVLV